MPLRHPERGDTAERMLGWAALAMSPLPLGLAGLQVFHYRLPWAGAFLLGIAVLFGLSPVVHRRGGSTMHWVNGLIVLALSVTSYARGGVIVPILTYAVIPPIVCAVLLRPRAAIGWALVTLAVVLAIYGLERAGLTPPRIEATATGEVVGLAGALVGTVVVVLIQAWARRRAEEEAARIQERLLQSNKMESVARLAGGVAHDFNNLLAVVQSHARVVYEELPEGHALREDAVAIERAASLGADLTRRLLTVAREDPAGEQTMPLDVDHVVEGITRLLGKSLPDNVQLSIAPSEATVVVEAAQRQLEQVVMNLVINAADALPDGGSVTVSTRVLDTDGNVHTRYGELRPGRYAVLSVRDDGLGMDEPVLDRVLEPFFTTKGRERGTGLGLAVVHGVATNLEGGLDIESSPGEGTTVRVLLPRTLAEPVHTERPVAPEPSGPSTILLVEDDAAVRRATRRLLKLDGHEVLTASGGAEALEIFERAPDAVDVLLTDVVMPDMAGPELARRVREARPEIPVLFFSGYTGDVLELEDLAGERTEFVAKPVAREALQAALRRLAS